MITASEVMRCKNQIKDFCKEYDCVECPFYSCEEECLFMSVAPVDWTDRFFKSNGKITE